ncbi:MAG: acyl-CoA dehydratase activase [Acidobacteriota bacterium]
MKDNDGICGVDIGSVAISIAVVDREGRVLWTSYRFHRGTVGPVLREMLSGLPVASLGAVAQTTAAAPALRDAHQVDTVVAYITAAKRLHSPTGSLLVVGGEKFGLVAFDADGHYEGMRGNTSCAAGTGSFLDLQALRLGLSSSAELSDIALLNAGPIPPIASRCSVFAKTDLIHAQQEGYSIKEICDGLCQGLARNIAGALFCGATAREPIVFAGGVSRNRAVGRHLEQLLAQPLTVGERSHLYGAIGAALAYLDEFGTSRLRRLEARDLLTTTAQSKQSFYEPLKLVRSRFPDFEDHPRRIHVSAHTGPANPVEVDIFVESPREAPAPRYLGLDVGSTSTKAALVDAQGRVLSGYYTRTAGRPLAATQAIFEAIESTPELASFSIAAVSTTGSGRKFIGKLIGADLIVDEITAHARAACELDPRVDTIIEIGGQDAKFTTLRDGRVTFAQMNTVCAAGTGSFIEEQAARLGVPLGEVARRAEGVRAPLASDRCAVFMERDINHLMSLGHSVEEILAAVLFSVRENYLHKVANRPAIGERVCFQGATAKNRALVAAFEQDLGREILVSRYCHLSGAIGAAILVARDHRGESRFRGLGLHRVEIPIRAEVCELCTNRCRIRVADVHGEAVAFGFMCGRDYDVHHHVSANRSGFDLIREHKKCFQLPGPRPASGPTVGIPAALHLFEDLAMWRRFFGALDIRTVTSEDCRDGVKLGRRLAGAEFCAPITALHGHVHHLASRADYVFVPVVLHAVRQPHDRARLRDYCYYTQYAPSLVAMIDDAEVRSRCLLPLLDHWRSRKQICRELHQALQRIRGVQVELDGVVRAYGQALRFKQEGQRRLAGVVQREVRAAEGFCVVLSGRPYVVLSPHMNKSIPDLFSALGVKAFFLDMIPSSPESRAEIDPLLDAVNWSYGARILETAQTCARSEQLYPVLVTSFKCAPDSFLSEYFCRILDSHGKPYLILQIDEHDSNAGYETRIEAAVRAFANHYAAQSSRPALVGTRPSPPRALPVNPRLANRLDGMTLLYPNWDPLTAPLLVANLRRAGVDARVLEEDPLTIQRSMRQNSGQCIPINAMTQEFIDYVRKHDLDPARTALWIARGRVACGLRMYPYYIKTLLEAHGEGMEKASVYRGDLSHMEISLVAAVNTYFAYLFGGLLRRIGCAIRPYEKTPGTTTAATSKALAMFAQALENGLSKEDALERAMDLFDAIPRHDGTRPKVAIFGDLYVRDNDVMNQNLIETIEAAGGQVITTPYSHYLRIISKAYFRRWVIERRYGDLAKNRLLLAAIGAVEKRCRQRYEKYLPPLSLPSDAETEAILDRFHVRLEHGGESFDNLLKISHILKAHPDVALFVQTNPVFCCPSLVTEAMANEIRRATGVPVVTLTYDGTGAFKNDVIVPYLKFPRPPRNARGP